MMGADAMTLSELRAKDVINIRDGRSLGRVMDIEFCLCDGGQSCANRQPGCCVPTGSQLCGSCISAIIVPGETRFAHMLRGERAGIVIPWEMVCKIGDDVILVDVEVC